MIWSYRILESLPGNPAEAEEVRRTLAVDGLFGGIVLALQPRRARGNDGSLEAWRPLLEQVAGYWRIVVDLSGTFTRADSRLLEYPTSSAAAASVSERASPATNESQAVGGLAGWIRLLNWGAEGVILPDVVAARSWSMGGSGEAEPSLPAEAEGRWLVPIPGGFRSGDQTAEKSLSWVGMEPAVAVRAGAIEGDWLIRDAAQTWSADWFVERFWSSLKIDSADGLVPTVVCDPLGTALGLAWSSQASLARAIQERLGCYWSRSRQEMWIKGETSGATQSLLGVALDCDRDTLRFTVEQAGSGFCHLGTDGCFGDDRSLGGFERILRERIATGPDGSYTRKLAGDPELLGKKLLEEAAELARAEGASEGAWEAADLLYFSLIAAMRQGAGLAGIRAELARRMNRIERRPEKPVAG